ncbi:tripartite tricarboxylate transporter TctB family protein [Agrobacterium tumefaciens]|uniref:tripartite tricarboxylate transporter TctB family protein n=1 Tax=Agrobacterium tumefaciens TaxID=358 RepID=UPI0015729ECB|nr:tripartite tricarboxylate transporter TctB family protein [Agrobacterium tumefaciens]NSY52129.1 tripartite tricarboxylate transporter TctB family protein [Agrobacterium tumefaciens]NTC81587.1 tripartite tricarboxylate transporter TctB family protein [Agrobacterium tumefaciens]NTD11168.1 tripartite tricarboxylate transporter TctB family protein [Agrobacterium tumefaciens]NTD87583.1 tripartite tricarboxylate transporter TctB family protein [Agrobacterium tumefaciens]NTD92654.1 tripartite tric
MDIKNIAASGTLLAVGIGFGISSLFTMDVGSALKMGPGYFPLILSIVIAVIGAVIGIKALRDTEVFRPQIAPLRALAAIIVAPILFGLTVRGLGFVPAVALTSLSAATAAAGQRPLVVLAITLGITVFCLGVFYYGLGLPVRLIGHWLGV